MTSSIAPFTVDCPSCGSTYPVDPAKVPDEGIHAICTACMRVFEVLQPDESEEVPGWADVPEREDVLEREEEPAVEAAAPPEDSFEDLTSLASEALEEEVVADPVPPAAPDAPGDEGPSVGAGATRFGRRDPHERARHLARVLVSDIIAYYPERYRESFERGTLQDDFRDEVEKSRKEYVDQVGSELANSTDYFQDALNHVLGQGKFRFDA